jgi:hypothetical protein
VRDADGRPQQLVVFGLGKLGGGELNFARHRPGLCLSAGRRIRRPAPAGGRGVLRPPRPAPGRCWTKPPSMASATASTCACARSAAPVGWRCRSRRWTSTSSAKAATGSAMRG